MMRRCYNKDDIGYKWYGKKGVIVCKEWHNYHTFRDWALKNGCAHGLQLDRINNKESYNPTNCRFISQTENIYNSGAAKLTKLLVQEIRDLWKNSQITRKELAKMYRISTSQLSRILTYDAWREV